jgi:hypothetical protein
MAFPVCRDDGVGLAAPQVGVNVRMMVYNPTGKRGDPEYMLVNPKVLSMHGRRELHEEGCLSFPRVFADVEVSSLPASSAPRKCWGCPGVVQGLPVSLLGLRKILPRAARDFPAAVQ